MQGVCEHNLYICHCSSSSPPTTTRRNEESLDPRGRTPPRRIPLYVSQTSVAVMTSPTTAHTFPLRHRPEDASALPTVSYYGDLLRPSSSPPNNPIKLRFSTGEDGRRNCLEKTVFSLLLAALLVVGFIACLVSFLHFGNSSSSTVILRSSGEDSDQSLIKEETLQSFVQSVMKKCDYYQKSLPPLDEKDQGPRRKEKHHSTKRVCVSRECEDLSKSMLYNIDADSDPCDSFYQFACGGWMARNTPPPRRLVHSVMSKRRDDMDHLLRDLILKIRTKNADHADKQLRAFYDSCMDINSIRSKGFVPAVQFINDKFSDFFKSRVERSSRARDKKRLTDLILRLLKINGTPVFDISLDLSPWNSSSYIGVIKVPQKSGLLPKLLRSRRSLVSFNRLIRLRRNSRNNHKYVSRKEIFKSFQNALNAQRVASLVKTAERIGILENSSPKRTQKDIDEILGFLAALERVLPSEKSMKENVMRSVIYNEYTLEELEKSFRYVNWTTLINGLFETPVNKYDVFLVHNPLYMRKLGRIISLFDSRIVWKSLLVLFAKDMLTDLVLIHHGSPRWQYCTQMSAMLFGEGIARLYVQSIPMKKRRDELEQVRSIFHLIKGKIIRKLNGLSWLSPKTKILTKDKVSRIEASFYGSDMFLNQTFIDSRYSRVVMGNSFFDNVLFMFKHFRNSIYHLIAQKVDKEAYIWNLVSFPFTVNAFHIQQLNSIAIEVVVECHLEAVEGDYLVVSIVDYHHKWLSDESYALYSILIVIPSGILEEIHFKSNIPMYLNLGSLGLTLAHEIFHSLDEMGRNFNAQGIFENWWIPSAERALNNVSHCIRNQYVDHFRRPLKIDTRSIIIEVDGSFTLNENICDVDGMNVVSEVLKDMSSNNFKDVVHLPNNPYPPVQLFFVNIAQAYCSHVGPVSYVLYLELDEHSPNPERVDGLMMNTDLFSKAFHCPVGSRMNPKKKCSVWT